MNTNDVLTMLLAVRDSMAANNEAPDVPRLTNYTGDAEKNWYDPRRPLASDVWRALEGLSLKYHGNAVPYEVKAHAEHGAMFFGGHPCLCEVCIAHRKKMSPSGCNFCNGTKKILEDHDGRAGYRPCLECT